VRKKVFVFGVLLIAAAAWIYLSPRLAAKRFRDAALAGDVTTLNDVIDFPSVREHLRADLTAKVAGRVATADRNDPLGTALGTRAGGAMVNGLVERFVSARGIASLARYGSTDSTSTVDVIAMGYRDPSNFGVTVGKPQSSRNTVTFVFHRSGVSWRLAQLEIPSLTNR